MYMCVHICMHDRGVCMCMNERGGYAYMIRGLFMNVTGEAHGSENACGCQRTTLWGWFFPSALHKLQ